MRSVHRRRVHSIVNNPAQLTIYERQLDDIDMTVDINLMSMIENLVSLNLDARDLLLDFTLFLVEDAQLLFRLIGRLWLTLESFFHFDSLFVIFLKILFGFFDLRFRLLFFFLQKFRVDEYNRLRTWRLSSSTFSLAMTSVHLLTWMSVSLLFSYSKRFVNRTSWFSNSSLRLFCSVCWLRSPCSYCRIFLTPMSTQNWTNTSSSTFWNV